MNTRKMESLDPDDESWWRDPASIWHAHPANHQLIPDGQARPRYEWVRKQIAPGSKVLDVGCNCGQLAANLVLDLDCQVTGVDIVPAFVEHCREAKAAFGRFFWMDFSRWPLPPVFESAFDVVTALELIEHPIHIRGFRDNAWGALRPGGKLVITTPHPQSHLTGHDFMRANPSHVRMWSHWRLEAIFGPCVTYTDSFPGGPDLHIGAVFIKGGR